MNVETKGGGAGIGIVELLQVAFIVLKLCGVIKWSWIWVLAPTWIGLIIAGIVVGIIFFLWKRK